MKFIFKLIQSQILKSFVLIVLFSPIHFAQAPDTLWTKTFGGSNIDIGSCVMETSDHGFIITGYTRSYGTMSGRNLLFIKTDAFGNTVWINGYGGNNDDEGNSVVQTSDGGFVASGYTKSYGSGGNDVYLVKIDSNGTQLWDKVFGGASDEEAYSSVATEDGGFLLAGATSSFGSGSRDVWLIRTDASGNLLWTKTIGGLSSDGARSVSKTSDGGFIITGWTFSYGPGAVGNVWLIKTDSLGNTQWNTFFGGTDVDRGLSVRQTNDGGFILTGYTASFGAGLDDMLLIKTDSSGSLVWQKTFGGSGRDYGNSVIQTSDGGYLVAGYTLSFGAGGDDLWMVKTNVSGNLIWSKTLGGAQSDVGNYVIESSDGSYIVTGHTLSFGSGLHDVWLIKSGSVIPVEMVSFDASIAGNNVLLEWLTTTETNNRGFEVQRSVRQVLSGGDMIFNWVIAGFVDGIGTTTEPQRYSFADNELIPGIYTYRLKQFDFDGTYSYSRKIDVEVGIPKIFKLEQNYPNPFNPSTKISWQLPVGSMQTLKIFDVLGNEISTLVSEYRPAGKYEVNFNASTLPSGVYFYQLKAGDYVAVKKLILAK